MKKDEENFKNLIKTVSPYLPRKAADGKLPSILVHGKTLAEATHNTIIGCHDLGARVMTPKHRPNGSLGFDADINVYVDNPDEEPLICTPALVDDPRGIMQYILEVTHGIHNHWKKSEKHPDRWGYTYNERFVDQLPFVFQRIKADWEEKGRITGRDYLFTTWRPGEDIILEQDDPPCFQSGQLRFIPKEDGTNALNYKTSWRSRDLFKAGNENNIAQLELMRLFRDKVSDMLGIQIELGAYTDHSDSLHLYGFYLDRDNMGTTIENMKRDGLKSMSLKDYFGVEGGATRLKRLIAAQDDAERQGHGLNQSEKRLKELGYDIDTFEYPADWDSWPKEWDAEPDESKLARVI